MKKLEELFGIGKATACALRKENIWNPYDLAMTFPKSYENYNIVNFDEAKHEEIITIIGQITDIKTINAKIHIIKMIVKVDVFQVEAIIFQQPFLLNQIKIGDLVLIKGKYYLYKNQISVTKITKNLNQDEIVGKYNISDITDYTIRRALRHLLDDKNFKIYETLPEDIRNRYKLISRREAIKKMHFPTNNDDLAIALKRFKFEEAINIQLRLHKNKINPSLRPVISYNIDIVKKFISLLPFELTDDQKKAVNDIYRDFKSEKRAKRLIQGDVGSGKTIVAIIAALGAITANKQVVFMAPTEILATQQYQNVLRLLPNLRVRLLTSKTKEKVKLKEEIKTGKIDFLIGTHAVAVDDVWFHDLGLVIIDEQHKFGVDLRDSLINKSEFADLIYLTATPIPRTLGITIFADMETSIIKAKPSGQKTVKTSYLSDKDLEVALRAIDKASNESLHSFVVVPAISSELKDATINSIYPTLFERYGDKLFTIHGNLSSIEQNEVITNFLKTKGAILLATSMIEVGIDVPSATTMVVLAAENFGLSQLHQLRGRVGRGNHESYFFLVSKKEDVKRLNLLESINDGFILSEYDLKLRGPGDFFGTKQSGLMDCKYLDLASDYSILVDAKKIANYVIRKKDRVQLASYYYLNKIINEN